MPRRIRGFTQRRQLARSGAHAVIEGCNLCSASGGAWMDGVGGARMGCAESANLAPGPCTQLDCASR